MKHPIREIINYCLTVGNRELPQFRRDLDKSGLGVQAKELMERAFMDGVKAGTVSMVEQYPDLMPKVVRQARGLDPWKVYKALDR